MKRYIILILTCAMFFCSCGTGEVYTGEIPTVKFSHMKYDEDGNQCFYLFDDNPEYLTAEFLADGDVPSSIAHFGELKKGKYTIFSYHHRGTAAEGDVDLFFDVLFRGNAEFKINKIGFDHDWQWNKAWADYSGVDVYLPEYLKTSDCSCADKACAKNQGICEPLMCSCSVTDELVEADSSSYKGLGAVHTADKLLLSDVIPNIKENRINEIRHGGRVEPIWLMMEFEVLSGSMSADTIAYLDYNSAVEQFDTMRKGRFVDEPQYKGIAENAPVVEAELEYVFDNTTGEGALPVRFVNQRYPEGYIAKDGSFGVYVNTWKREEVLSAESAESDIMRLKYKDDSKLSLYGDEVSERDNMWSFDPFHTCLYQGEGQSDFVPNASVSTIDYPMGEEKTNDEFYSKYICNLGNFGVRYLYTISLKNKSNRDRIFKLSLNSVSGHLYRYSLLCDNKAVNDDGGRYIMKKFDMQPSENEKPSWYTTTEDFRLESDKEYVLKFETVVLTGCDAPMEVNFSVY